MTRKKCRPLYRNKNVPHLQFAQNLKCVADQLSVDKKSRQIQTRPLLDYHFLKNNCAAATRLIVECAGGQVSLRPNLSVGDKFEWDQIVYGEIEYKNYVISESNYETTIKDVCNKVRESCGMGLLAN